MTNESNDSQKATETPQDATTEKTEETATENKPTAVEPTIEVLENTTSTDTTVYTETFNEIEMKTNDQKTEGKTDNKTTEKKETAPQTEKKTETSNAVVKKDYTALVAAAVALVLLVGLYVWQNYKKRKEDENTIDVNPNQYDGPEYQQ